MFTDLRLALSLLTVVPTGAQWSGARRTGVAGWFPLVGLLLGSVVWSASHIGQLVGWSGSAPLVLATIVVGYFALSTRMLHLDGLADVADAWWGGHTRERRLEIMGDSATGAFGTTAVSLAVVLQVTSIGLILASHHQLPLLLVPALGRFAATCASWLGTPARPGGLGRSVIGRPRLIETLPTVVVMSLVFLVAVYAMQLAGAVFVLLGIALALVVPHVIALRMGGVTGDVMGASVVIVESSLFAVASVGLMVLS